MIVREGEREHQKSVNEHEEIKMGILKEYPHISKDTLEFVLSLPLEKKENTQSY
jgi:hypothetical protein